MLSVTNHRILFSHCKSFWLVSVISLLVRLSIQGVLADVKKLSPYPGIIADHGHKVKGKFAKSAPRRETWGYMQTPKRQALEGEPAQ